MSQPGAPDGAVVVRLPSQKPVVPLQDKAAVMDRALLLVAQNRTSSRSTGRLRGGDLAILWYLLSSLDAQTGEAVRRYETIAARCGISRGQACKAVTRLKVYGLIEAQPRYREGRRDKFSTAFTVSQEPEGGRRPSASTSEKAGGGRRPSASTVDAHRRLPSTPRGVGNLSHCINNLVGPSRQDQARQEDGADLCAGELRATPEQREILLPLPVEKDHVTEDWSEIAADLAERGGYQKYGFGYIDLAKDDLATWRDAAGDTAVRRAWQRARSLRLYGDRLVDYMGKTWPSPGHKTGGGSA